MERIQLALEKARARRNDDVRGDPARRALPNSDPVPTARNTTRSKVWAALPGFLPDPTLLDNNRVVAATTGLPAIPFDVMRTKLLYQMRSNNWRRLAITSPGIGCGKTMTCVNLAFSLSRQSDVSTMVIELDLRRPTMAKVLGLTDSLLFASVMEGSALPEEHMMRYGANLIFATNHSPARNPAELLQGVDSARIIDAVEERFKPDVMIFDMPPVLVSDDTMAFLDQVDCCLLIGAAETTTIEEIEKCSQEIASRTNLLGVVLNKCRYMEKTVDYGY
jgi:Mrp family chromosome partitioning ATPase